MVGIPRELNASFTKTLFKKNPSCRNLYQRIEAALEAKGESLNSIAELNNYEHLFGIKSEKKKKRYQQFWGTFLKASTEQPEQSITTFVDSSKTSIAHAFRPYFLQRMEGVDVSMVHIIKHPRSILHRFKKKAVLLSNRDEPRWLSEIIRIFKTTLNWTFSNIWPAIFSYKLGSYVRVSFEDLCEFPIKTLEKIQNECSLDLSDTIDRVKNNKPLPPTCGIAGNIGVKKQEKELRFESSKKTLPKTGPFISLLSLFLLPVYKILTR